MSLTQIQWDIQARREGRRARMRFNLLGCITRGEDVTLVSETPESAQKTVAWLERMMQRRAL